MMHTDTPFYNDAATSADAPWQWKRIACRYVRSSGFTAAAPRKPVLRNMLSGTVMVVAALLIASAAALAQPGGNAPPPGTEPPAAEPAAQADMEDSETPKSRLDIARLEREYDTYLTNMIGAYFDPASFFVHTSIGFTMVEQQLRERATDQAVTEIIEEALPGLAAIPEFMRQTGRQPDERRERTLVQLMPDIDRLEIELTIREDYSGEEEAFIAYLASSSAKLNEDRGDTIRVIRRPFPGAAAGAPAVMPGTEIPPAEPGEPDDPGDALLSGWQDTLTELWRDHPEAVAAGLGLLGLLLLTLLILGIRRSRRRKKEAALTSRNMSRQSEPDSEPAQAPAGPAAVNTNGTPGSSSETRVKEKVFAGRTPEEYQPEEILMRYFMQYTEDMARLLDEWIETRDDTGIAQAMRLLLGTDPKLAERLRMAMEPVNWDRLHQSLEQEAISGYTPDRSSQDPIIVEIIETLRRRERPESLYFRLRTLRSFDFLDYARIDVLTSCFNAAEPGEQALIAAHLGPDRLDPFLSGMPQERIPSIWSAMDRVRFTTRREYVHNASRIFQTMTLAEKEMETGMEPGKDMVEMVASRVERQPVARQNTMFRQFLADESALSRAVSQYLITMENLADVPEEAIRMACEPMDAQQLAYALGGQPEELVGRILEDRPQRERQLFASIMQERDTFSGEETEKAMQDMLTRLRTIIRSQDSVLENKPS